MNAKKARKMLRAAEHITKKARSREFVESGRDGAMLEVARRVAAEVAKRRAMPHLTASEWKEFKNAYNNN